LHFLGVQKAFAAVAPQFQHDLPKTGNFEATGKFHQRKFTGPNRQLTDFIGASVPIQSQRPGDDLHRIALSIGQGDA
jgi:hypothetical protein